MSEIFEKELRGYLEKVTPAMIEEKKNKFDAYMSRKYNGKPWRRLSDEEIKSLGDKELLGRIEDLNDVIKIVDGVVVESSDSREITGNQEFIIGAGGDISGPDGRPLASDEDFARLDDEIASERKRIYRLVTAPPRTGRYLEIFKRKFPNKTEQEIMNGFVLSENGVDTPDYTAWRERQNATHKRAGKNRLSHVEVARRESISPENTDALAYADPNAMMAIHREVLGNSLGADTKQLKQDMDVGFRQSIINSKKFLVGDDEGFVPEQDLVDPEIYKLTGDIYELPVDEYTKKQKDSLKITEIVRFIPPKEEVNG